MPAYALAAGALFLSAFLLFSGEILFARALLPRLGGAPAVWTSCLFTYQGLLVLGYGYAHLLEQRVPARARGIVHAAVLLAGGLSLPIAVVGADPGDGALTEIFALILRSIGGPFFALAATAPLVSSWMARHAPEREPYRLYALSNLGSLLALLLGPLVFDRFLGLTAQAALWAGAYVVLAAAILLSWLLTRHSAPAPSPIASGPRSDARSMISWLILSLAPASLLQGVTTLATQDLAAIPFLWAIPLILYLLSFALGFSSRPLPASLKSVVPIWGAVLIVLSLLPVPLPVWLSLPLHFGGIFLLSLLLHRQLYAARPASAELTRYYLFIAIGGALGGALNAVAAPLMFSTLREYPLGLSLALILVSAERRPALGPQFLGLGLLLGFLLLGFNLRDLPGRLAGHLCFLALVGLGAWTMSQARAKVAAGLLTTVLVGQFSLESATTLVTERSFFGVSRVFEDRVSGLRTYVHGTTIHGRQALDPQRAQLPVSYYAPSSPLGRAFGAWSSERRLRRVAVLGLGVGVLLAHAEPEQQWRFFEIDPVVLRIAEDPRYFTFLAASKARFEVVLGDARQSLARAEERARPPYDLMVLDSFSSDAVPVHLLTVEALTLDLSLVAPAGILAVNISNRSLDLLPVIAAAMRELGLRGITAWERTVSAEEAKAGKTPSRWVLLARSEQALASALASDPRWSPLEAPTSARAWTDDYSDVLSTIRW